MYVVLDNNDIIGFHEEYDVCKKYVDNVYKHHKVILEINKLKKKKRNLLFGLDDLYLVRYGYTYIQEGYLLYVELSSEQIVDDIRYARDVIYRILGSQEDLTGKEVSTLSKSTKILEDLYIDASTYTPLLSDLKNLKQDYDPYLYNTGII